MAEKKDTKKKVEKKKAKGSEYSNMSVHEMKREANMLKLRVLSGEEQDTSKVKKLRKEIARRLTGTVNNE